jgi:protein-S-isoprenylcysteine O-methyltransferase Ste14
MGELRVKVGRALFRSRNVLGPVLFVVALLAGRPRLPFGRPDLDLAFDAAGVLVALLGQALRALTIGYEYIDRGGRNRQVWASKLVTGGVFGHCRNPMYVGNVLIAAGLALIIHSPVYYLLVLPAILLAYSCIVAAEEAYLRVEFGDEYARYCARVPRWWPRWRGWSRSMDGLRFNWQRVLVKEYNTMFLLVLALVTARLWSVYVVRGAEAVPSAQWLAASLGLWLASYLTVRLLKKTSLVRA